MTAVRKTIAAALAAVTLAASTAAFAGPPPPPPPPHFHHHHGPGFGWGLGGLAAGMVIGSAMASRPAYVEEVQRCTVVERVNRWGEVIGTRRICRTD